MAENAGMCIGGVIISALCVIYYRLVIMDGRRDDVGIRLTCKGFKRNVLLSPTLVCIKVKTV